MVLVFFLPEYVQNIYKPMVSWWPIYLVQIPGPNIFMLFYSATTWFKDSSPLNGLKLIQQLHVITLLKGINELAKNDENLI